VVCAHSLGSLICYDTFKRNPGALTNRALVTFGSQIGNPFVRDCFAGRIEPLDARIWYHLYNRDDRMFTAEVRVQAHNFVEIQTPFDKPNDLLNHDPVWYFNHANTQERVWADLAEARPARAAPRHRDVPRARRPARAARPPHRDQRLPEPGQPSRVGAEYLGANGATHRIGRAVSLRTLPNRAYDRECRALKHRGPYLPIIFEACREEQLSYEYRDGVTSYGAFTYSLAKALRESRSAGRNPSFRTLAQLTASRLRALDYDQTPALVGPRRLLGRPIPWARPRSRRPRAASVK